MSIRISELKKMYIPTFDTEEERLAWEAAQQEKFEAAVADKINALKNLYNANPDKYSKFNQFTDEDWTDYATKELQYYGTYVNANYMANLVSSEGIKPDDEEWARFTYEEILQMEADGVLIPDEVLAWAHSMEESDVNNFEYEDDGSEDVNDSPASEFDEMKKNTQKLSEKSKRAQADSKQKFEEMNEISKHAEKIKYEQENAQKDSLKEIQDLTKEYDSLAQKVKKGEQLDDKEKKRYQELGTMLNGKDGELVADVQASSTELEELINSIDGLNSDIVKNIEIGDDTIEAATQLAWYESGYKDKNTDPNFFMNVSVSDICETLFSTKGESVAKDALNNGENLIEYSNVLGNQLIMNQYVSLYEFATTFTTNASETINITKEVMGADFNKSSEEFEEEGEIEGQETEESDEELNMGGLTKMGLGTRKLTEKVLETQQNSAKLAKEAVEEIKALNKENAKLLEEKQAVISDQVQDAQAKVQTQNAENTEDPQNAPEDVKEPEDPQKSTETEEINGEIEANNEKGLTKQEKLKKSLKTNEKYDDFNKDANDVMTLTGSMGSLSTVYGGTLIANGSQLISIGVPLLGNIFTHLIGVAFVSSGTILVTAGTGFVGVGTDLIAIAVDGTEAVNITGQQIDLTDETIQSAMDAIENSGLLEEEQMSEAESKRAEMIKNGASLPEQAKYFKEESSKNGRAASTEIMANAEIQSKSNKEGKSAEKTAKSVEFWTKRDKKEYDELKEKYEDADAKKEDAMEKAARAGANPDDLKSDDDFSDSDKKRMEELEARLKSFGNKRQQKLFNALTKIEGLEKLLEDKDETALKAIDYGTVAQIVGTELFDSVKGHIFLIFKMVLALATKAAGESAQKSGESLNETVDETRDVIDKNRTKINNAQTKVTELTMAEAVNPVGQNEDSQDDNQGDSQSDAQSDTQGDAQGTAKIDNGANSQNVVNVGIGTQGSIAENNIGGQEDGKGAQSPVMSESVEKVQETPETANVVNNMRPSEKSPSGKLTGAAAIAAWSDPVGEINAIRAKYGIDPRQKLSDIQPGNSSKKEKEEEEDNVEELIENQNENDKSAKEETKTSKDAKDEAKKDEKDSQGVKKDAEKSEKQLTKEGNNIVKFIEQDQKEIDNLTKDSEKAVEEQLALIDEFEALNAQNDSIVSEATQNSGGGQQPASPMLSAQNGDDQQGGGLLGVQQSGGMQDTTMPAKQAELDTNNKRLETISTRFMSLGVRINKNRLSMIKIQGSINKRVRKYEKITKQKIAMQKKAKKAEEAKQKKLQKTLTKLDIVSNVFSILASIATLMQVLGVTHIQIGTVLIATGTPMLSNPFTAAAGAALIAAGTVEEATGSASEAGGLGLAGYCAIGAAVMQLAKAGVLLANGYSMQALTSVITAAISIAASVAGAGGAADGVLAGISSGLSIVSSSATLVADVQTLKGKEPSGWLNTVSQVTGALSAVTGIASGFAGGKNSAFSKANAFGKATQIVGATGTLVSTSAQVSAMIKQAEGKNPGKFENIMGMIGAGLSTASSVMSLGQSLVQSFNAKKADGKGQDNTPKPEQSDQKSDKSTSKSDQSNQKSDKSTSKSNQSNQKSDKSTPKTDKSDNNKKPETENKTEKKNDTKQDNNDKKTDEKKSDTKQENNDKKADEEESKKSLEIAQVNSGDVMPETVELPETTETTQKAFDELDQKSSEVENNQTADDIENFNLDEHNSEQKQEVEKKVDTKQENNDKKADEVESKDEVETNDENETKDENKTKDENETDSKDTDTKESDEKKKEKEARALRKQKRKEKFKKTMEVINKVQEGASAGSQVYSLIDSMLNDGAEEQDPKSPDFSRMKKGYALMKKVNDYRRKDRSKIGRAY